jgi:hypothetical protein
VKARGRKPKPIQGRGPIDGNAVYPIGIFLRRLGISRNSLTSLRRRGLPVRNIGRRCAIVCGWEFLDFLRSENAEQSSTHPKADGENCGDSAETVLPTVLGGGPRS